MRHPSTTLTISTAALCVALASCDKDETAAAEQPAATSQGIGVAECDEYVQKMSACLAKMTEQARAGAEPAFKQNQENWKKAAAEGVDLKPTCQAALTSVQNNALCK